LAFWDHNFGQKAWFPTKSGFLAKRFEQAFSQEKSERVPKSQPARPSLAGKFSPARILKSRRVIHRAALNWGYVP